MILLKSLKIHNFLSHADSTITFKEDEDLLIDGQSGDGKSSIFDAIVWALYGVSRSDGRGVIRKSQAAAVVELVLERKEDESSDSLCITRAITSTGKHTLDVTILDSDGDGCPLPSATKTERQEWIEKDLLGASHLLFVNSVAYVQGNTESFLSQSAARRKELLLELVKVHDLDSLY